MRVFIVRHAWAGQAGDPAYPDDGLRPLTPEGVKRFGKFLRKLPPAEFDPQAVATSPLVRCAQTADLVAETAPHVQVRETLEALAPGSQLAPLLAWSQSQAGDVAWVGHAPDVGELTAALIGGPTSFIHFSKGAIACIEFAGRPEADRGELRWLATAKLFDV